VVGGRLVLVSTGCSSSQLRWGNESARLNGILVADSVPFIAENRGNFVTTFEYLDDRSATSFSPERFRLARNESGVA